MSLEMCFVFMQTSKLVLRLEKHNIEARITADEVEPPGLIQDE